MRDVVVDKDGSQHVRYDRTYRHLPVLGGDFIVHLTPDGAYRSADRAVRGDLAVPTVTPSLSASGAADLGAAALRSAHRGVKLSKVAAQPQLVVDALHGAPRLAWRTEAAGKDSLGNPVARVVLTDARTGRRDRCLGQPGDGVRRRPVAVQRYGPAADDPVGIDVPAQGCDARQHLLR